MPWQCHSYCASTGTQKLVSILGEGGSASLGESETSFHANLQVKETFGVNRKFDMQITVK